jgi:two-component system LytT family response regulator
MKAIIVEDEALALRNLQIILDELGTIQVIATLETILETIEWFKTHAQPDILFLDIHLADGSAFEIFKHTSINCPVIFTTAYDEYALQAFKVNSIDYLLKPINTSSVEKAIEKLKKLSNRNFESNEFKKLLSQLQANGTYKTHFLVNQKGDKLIPLKVNDVFFFYIESGVVKAITNDEKSFVMENTLDELSEMLNPSDFFRANRQFIISRTAIKDIDLWFNSRLSINLKISVPEKILVSKARISEFKTWFA